MVSFCDTPGCGRARRANGRRPVRGQDRRELAAVFAGGALGATARAVLETVVDPDPTRWPWPTFAVNIVGALLLGYVTTRLLERLPVSTYRRPLLGTDRKSTRLNSSHVAISYAVFCLKKKN